MMKRVTAKVSLVGVSGMLHNRFLEGLPPDFGKMKPEEQASLCVYREPAPKGKEARVALPAMNVKAMVASGGKYVKAKGRATCQKLIGACLQVSPDWIEVTLPDGSPAAEWELDSRSVVNPSTGGRQMKHRPCFPKWRVEFSISWPLEMMSEAQVKSALEMASELVGLSDYRLENGGPFGRFELAKFEVSKK
jgi:hypothetical protein